MAGLGVVALHYTSGAEGLSVRCGGTIA